MNSSLDQTDARSPDIRAGWAGLLGAAAPRHQFWQKELATITASVAGGLIGFYQIGYGIAAFGVGPLQTWAQLDLASIYGGTAVIALALAALSFAITPPAKTPA